MAHVERLPRARGLALPAELEPSGGPLPFAFVRGVGARALLSSHGPLDPDGSLARPLGFSDLILDPFGPEIGARSAVGVAELPFDIPVEDEGEIKA